MIYFNDLKMASNISFGEGNDLATVSDEIWIKYCIDKAGSSWDIIDGQFVQITSPEQMIFNQLVEEQFYRRRTLHQQTDNDYAKYSRIARTGTTEQKAEAEIILAKIDAYNNAVSDTVNQTGFPQTVTYPDKTW